MHSTCLPKCLERCGLMEFNDCMLFSEWTVSSGPQHLSSNGICRHATRMSQLRPFPLSLEIVCQIFDAIHFKEVISWTAIIAGYSHNGLCNEALNLYRQMDRQVCCQITSPSLASFLHAAMLAWWTRTSCILIT